MTTEIDPVIVTGAPRSGTTLLAKILSQLGIFMGFNQNDAWEDWFFVKCNEHMLDKLDLRWDRPLRVADREARMDQVDPENMARLMKESPAMNVDVRWGWKDPRTTLFMPLWKKVLDEFDLSYTEIRITRHPMDCAVSLMKREKQKPDEFMHRKKPNNRSLRSKGINTYPLVSRRCMNLAGALGVIERYTEVWDGYDMEIRFEELVQNPRPAIYQIASLLDREIGDELKEQVSDLVNKDRAHAYKSDDELVQFWSNYQ